MFFTQRLLNEIYEYISPSATFILMKEQEMLNEEECPRRPAAATGRRARHCSDSPEWRPRHEAGVGGGPAMRLVLVAAHKVLYDGWCCRRNTIDRPTASAAWLAFSAYGVSASPPPSLLLPPNLFRRAGQRASFRDKALGKKSSAPTAADTVVRARFLRADSPGSKGCGYWSVNIKIFRV